MSYKKHFERLDALLHDGPVSLDTGIETLTKFEGLQIPEARIVFRAWLKRLTKEPMSVLKDPNERRK
jgi:hypothetical protein